MLRYGHVLRREGKLQCVEAVITTTVLYNVKSVTHSLKRWLVQQNVTLCVAG